MDTREFIAPVSNGHLPAKTRNEIKNLIGRFEGKKLRITVGVANKKRTLSQNSYWKGVLVPLFTHAMNRYGCQLTEYQADLVMKDGINFVHEIAMPDGEIKRVPRSTTELSTVEMAQKVEEVIAWAASAWDVILPYPHEEIT